MAMMRRGSGSLDVEPAVKATTANRLLMQKNIRASDNWIKAKSALEREKKKYENKVSMDKNALLKQRERLQNSTLTLDTVHEIQDNTSTTSTPRLSGPGPQQPFSTTRRMTLADVYDSLIKSVREQKPLSNGDNRSVQSEPTNLLQASTASFDSKKVARKPAKFTLQSLQRAQSNLQDKIQALAQAQDDLEDETPQESQSEPTTPRGLFDLDEEEMQLGPKLLLAPTTLPPIRSQSVFKPRSRSFDRPMATPQVGDIDVEDIRYCRYIRGAVRNGRRNSAPVVRHGVMFKRQAKKSE